MNTPNGQKVQIMLEELKEIYGTEWTKTMMYDSIRLLGMALKPLTIDK